jgi:hypothetical protein
LPPLAASADWISACRASGDKVNGDAAMANERRPSDNAVRVLVRVVIFVIAAPLPAVIL